MKPVRAGNLRQRVTIQKKVVTLDDYGQESAGWVTVLADEPAQVQPMSASEFVRSNAQSMIVTHKVTMRYRNEFLNTQVMAGWRITTGSRIMNIVSVMNIDERNIMIEMLANEGTQDGQ